MNETKRTLIGAILLLAVLTALFGGFLLLSNIVSKNRQRMEARVSEIKAIDEALHSELQLYLSVAGSVTGRGISETLVSAEACRKLADSGDLGPMLFLNGAVVRVTDKGIETPKGFPADVKPDAAQLQGEAGNMYTIPVDAQADTVFYVINYSRIDGELYYIEWESYDALDAEAKELFDYEKSFAATEKAFATELLIILVEGEEHRLFYRSKGLPDCRSAEELGITADMLSGAFSASDELTADALLDRYRIIDIDGQSYELIFRQLGGEVMPAVVAYLTPFRDAKQLVWEQTGIGVAVFAIIGTVFLVWLFSLILLVRRHALNEKQREEYSVKRCRRRVFAILGVGAAVMLASTALFLSLFRLFDIHRQVDTALTALQQRLTENAGQSRITADANKETYEEYASLTAEILTEYPGVFDAEDFQTICDTIGADYLMLFDENGDEVMSNSDFVCLSLGKDASSASYEFRQLLTGVPLITREAVTDEQTRLKNVVIGARVGSPEEEGERYGALLLAVPEKSIYSGSAESVESVMRALVSGGMLAFSVDPGSGLFLDASDGTLSGLDAASLGLPERALKNGFQDFFKLGGVTYYGKNVSVDGALCFAAVRSEHIYSGIPVNALLAAFAAFALWSLLALYLLRVYRRTFDRFAAEGAALDDPMNELTLSDGTRRQSTDPSMRWRSGVQEDDATMPRRNAALTAQLLFVLCVVLLSVKLYAAQNGESASLIGFILQGQWTKGFNLFAVTSILLLLGETLVAVTAAKLLLRLLSRALGTRGETVCRLLLNLVGYAGGIFFVYYALYDLGFAPGTLLASLGLLSFAVSLGAKDLVTDIVAGLSIVFEGTYQVGDIIELAGYRGEVLEIGVRSTKLEGRGGNVKVIANRDVKNVVNMTRMHSWYALEVTVPADRTLEKTEALLREQLPKIGASIPQIISGPYYKGVTGLGKGNTTLSIIAECNEADYHTVQRALNRAVQEFFTDNEIRTM